MTRIANAAGKRGARGDSSSSTDNRPPRKRRLTSPYDNREEQEDDSSIAESNGSGRDSLTEEEADTCESSSEDEDAIYRRTLLRRKRLAGFERTSVQAMEDTETLEQSLARQARAKRRRIQRDEVIDAANLSKIESNRMQRGGYGTLGESSGTLMERMRCLFEQNMGSTDDPDRGSIYDLFEAFAYGNTGEVETVKVMVTPDIKVPPRSSSRARAWENEIGNSSLDKLNLRKISILPQWETDGCDYSAPSSSIVAPCFRRIKSSGTENPLVTARFSDFLRSSNDRKHLLRYTGPQVDGEKLQFNCPNDPLYVQTGKKPILPTACVPVAPTQNRNNGCTTSSSYAATSRGYATSSNYFSDMRYHFVSCKTRWSEWMAGERRLFWSLTRILGADFDLIKRMMSDTKSISQLEDEFTKRRLRDEHLGIAPRWEGIAVTEECTTAENSDALDHQQELPDWYHPLQEDPSWWFDICRAPTIRDARSTSEKCDDLDDMERTLYQCLIDSTKHHNTVELERFYEKAFNPEQEPLQGGQVNTDHDKLSHLEKDLVSRIRPFSMKTILAKRRRALMEGGMPPAEMLLHSILGCNPVASASVFSVNLPPLPDFNHRDLQQYGLSRKNVSLSEQEFALEFKSIENSLKVVKRASTMAAWVMARGQCASCKRRGRAGVVSIKSLRLPDNYSRSIANRSSLLCHPAMVELFRSSLREGSNLSAHNSIRLERMRHFISSQVSPSWDKLVHESPKLSGGWTNVLLNRLNVSVHERCKLRLLNHIEKEHPVAAKFLAAENYVLSATANRPFPLFNLNPGPENTGSSSNTTWLVSVDQGRVLLADGQLTAEVKEHIEWRNYSSERVCFRENDKCILFDSRNGDGLFGVGVVASYQLRTANSQLRAGKQYRFEIVCETDFISIKLLWAPPYCIMREYLLQNATLKMSPHKFKRVGPCAAVLNGHETEALANRVAELYPTARTVMPVGGNRSNARADSLAVKSSKSNAKNDSTTSLTQRAIDFVKYSLGISLPRSAPPRRWSLSTGYDSSSTESTGTQDPTLKPSTEMSKENSEPTPTIHFCEPVKCCGHVGNEDVFSANDTNLWCCVCYSSSGDKLCVMCDCCDRSFHLKCLKPKLKKVPSGRWFCPDCKDAPVADAKIEELQKKLLVQELRNCAKQLLYQQVRRVMNSLHSSVKRVERAKETDSQLHTHINALHSAAAYHLDRFWNNVMRATANVYLEKQ